MSVVFNLGKGNWAGRYSKMLAYKVDNGNYIANELNFTRTTTGTFINQDGFIKEQELRVPRVDYLNNSNGTLLLEPQRTNLETKSTDISGWSLASNVTRTASYITSLDGTSNATRLQFTSSGFLGNTLQVSGTEYTVSCYAKRNDTNTQSFGFFTNGSGVVNSAMSLTSSWKRFEFTYTATNTSYVGLAAESGADVSVFGFQVEQGSFPTSYIPTSGVSVTRAHDYFSGSFEEVTTQGTIFIDFEQLTQSQLNYRFRSPSYNVSYGFYFYGGGMDVYNGSAFMVDRTTLEPDNSKVAVSWNGTNVKVFINGNNRTKSNAVASIYTTSRIIFQDSNDIANLNEVKVYDTELTDEELINLTT